MSEKESIVYKVTKKGQRRNSSFMSNQKVVKEGTLMFKREGNGRKSPSTILPCEFAVIKNQG
jgi:hypothetical protein